MNKSSAKNKSQNNLKHLFKRFFEYELKSFSILFKWNQMSNLSSHIKKQITKTYLRQLALQSRNKINRKTKRQLVVRTMDGKGEIHFCFPIAKLFSPAMIRKCQRQGGWSLNEGGLVRPSSRKTPALCQQLRRTCATRIVIFRNIHLKIKAD